MQLTQNYNFFLNKFNNYLHYLQICCNFTQSFYDKYVTRKLMAKGKVLTSEEIKAIKAVKSNIINSPKIVKK